MPQRPRANGRGAWGEASSSRSSQATPRRPRGSPRTPPDAVASSSPRTGSCSNAIAARRGCCRAPCTQPRDQYCRPAHRPPQRRADLASERRKSSRRRTRPVRPRPRRVDHGELAGVTRQRSNGADPASSVRRRTRLLSISEASVSRSDSQTCSTASSECSRRERRPGRRRGASRRLRRVDRPTTNRGARSCGAGPRRAGAGISSADRRSRSASGARRRVRAAASSRASGSRSRWSQSSRPPAYARGPAGRHGRVEGTASRRRRRRAEDDRISVRLRLERLPARDEQPELRCGRLRGRRSCVAAAGSNCSTLSTTACVRFSPTRAATAAGSAVSAPSRSAITGSNAPRP